MLAVGEVAPDFSLKTYLGKDIKLSSFKGKVWLLKLIRLLLLTNTKTKY